MKRTVTIAALLVLLWTSAVQADTTKQLASVSRDAGKALAIFNCTFQSELAKQTFVGQAICIGTDNRGRGLFMALTLNPRMTPATLSDFSLTPPGANARKIKATLLGIDPELNIAFVRASEKYDWQVVKFAPSSNLSTGRQVTSIGLIPGDPAHTPYVGTAYISAVQRTPRRLVLVTGGKLTRICSPVFGPDGRAIGIISQQLYANYQMMMNRKTMNVGLNNMQETNYFLPVEEFTHVLKSIPMNGKKRKLPWLGVIRIEGVSKELASAMKLNRPGVMIDRIVPNFPAAKAGLKNRDVIVEVNGKGLEKLATPDLTARNLLVQLLRFKVGDTVTLTILRSGKTLQTKVKLTAMPKTALEANRYYNRLLGFVVREKVMLDEYADRRGSANVQGLIVVIVGRGTAASGGGLRRDDIITNVNAQAVDTVEAFRKAVETAMERNPDKAINLMIRRGDQNQAVAIQPPSR